jgi:hypothetical protein
MKPIWTYPLAWFVVVLVAVLLAFAGPRAHPALGHLPPDIGGKLDRVPVASVGDDDRMIVLVTFRRDQRVAAESWIKGLNLRNRAVVWVRMPVVDDPGDPTLRAQAEGRLLSRYADPAERENLVPLVTNRALFVAATGLHDTTQAHVLVINRRGEVLARVAGEFDAEKAATVLDTVSLREL